MSIIIFKFIDKIIIKRYNNHDISSYTVDLFLRTKEAVCKNSELPRFPRQLTIFERIL